MLQQQSPLLSRGTSGMICRWSSTSGQPVRCTRTTAASMFPGVVINHDISSTAIRALGHDVADRLVLAGGDDSVLATGDAFIADAATRDALAQRADLVDMEGFCHRIRRAGCGCYLPTRQTRQRSRGRLGLGLARDDRCQRPRVGALAARQRLIEPAASGQACAVSINPVSSGLRRVSVSASTV